MKKIRKSLQAIGNIIRNPYLLNLVLNENENWKRYVLKSFKDELPVISFGDLFGTFEESVSPFAFLDGGSLPTDLALLKGLAKNIEQCNYFEIGTWRGESVANVSKVARECYTMDLPDDEKRNIGMTEEYIQQYAVYSKELPNVIHLKANSLNFDFEALNKKFDLVFIDGDHHYDGVLNDTRKAISYLIHEKSVIVWHDYAFNPEKVRYEVFAAILDGCGALFQSNLYHVANTLCAIYYPGKLICSESVKGVFEIALSYRESGTK
ncbi:MAG: class I SAM-dependent methyltransferase [Bacteroidales bacterium]